MLEGKADLQKHWHSWHALLLSVLSVPEELTSSMFELRALRTHTLLGNLPSCSISRMATCKEVLANN